MPFDATPRRRDDDEEFSFVVPDNAMADDTIVVDGLGLDMVFHLPEAVTRGTVIVVRLNRPRPGFAELSWRWLDGSTRRGCAKFRRTTQ